MVRSEQSQAGGCIPLQPILGAREKGPDVAIVVRTEN